jgi:hypothetical protein
VFDLRLPYNGFPTLARRNWGQFVQRAYPRESKQIATRTPIV